MEEKRREVSADGRYIVKHLWVLFVGLPLAVAGGWLIVAAIGWLIAAGNARP